MHQLLSLTTLILALLFPCNSPQNQSPSNSPQASANSPTPMESKVACTDDSKPESSLPPPGQQCEEEQFAKRGRPVMFPSRSEIVYGVSSSPESSSRLSIWMDNRTDQTQNYLFCCGASFSAGIDVYDGEGRRLQSKKELAEQKLRDEGHESVEGCSCSGWVSVLPHTMKIVDQGDLARAYLLKPGRYTISQKPLPPAPGVIPASNTESKKAHDTPAGPSLTIFIP